MSPQRSISKPTAGLRRSCIFGPGTELKSSFVFSGYQTPSYVPAEALDSRLLHSPRIVGAHR